MTAYLTTERRGQRLKVIWRIISRLITATKQRHRLKELTCCVALYNPDIRTHLIHTLCFHVSVITVWSPVDVKTTDHDDDIGWFDRSDCCIAFWSFVCCLNIFAIYRKETRHLCVLCDYLVFNALLPHSLQLSLFYHTNKHRQRLARWKSHLNAPQLRRTSLIGATEKLLCRMWLRNKSMLELRLVALVARWRFVLLSCGVVSLGCFTSARGLKW